MCRASPVPTFFYEKRKTFRLSLCPSFAPWPAGNSAKCFLLTVGILSERSVYRLPVMQKLANEINNNNNNKKKRKKSDLKCFKFKMYRAYEFFLSFQHPWSRVYTYIVTVCLVQLGIMSSHIVMWYELSVDFGWIFPNMCVCMVVWYTANSMDIKAFGYIYSSFSGSHILYRCGFNPKQFRNNVFQVYIMVWLYWIDFVLAWPDFFVSLKLPIGHSKSGTISFNRLRISFNWPANQQIVFIGLNDDDDDDYTYDNSMASFLF